jgi:hypothetical protein
MLSEVSPAVDSPHACARSPMRDMTDPKNDDDKEDPTGGSTWRSARVAQALSECLESTALFAAPRAFERAKSKSRQGRVDKDAIVKRLDELGVLFQAEPAILGKGAMQQAPKLFATLRGLLEAWDAESAPGPELIAHARATLTALGLPEPPGGWDNYLPDE